jgi:hypothetical protein
VAEQTDVLIDIARRLETAGFDYMLTGSMALTFYAQPRFTRDVDLVIDLPPKSVKLFTGLFADDFATDEEAITEAVSRERMFNLIHHASVLKLDFIVRKATPYRREELRRRRRFVLGGGSVFVVSPEDLLLSKLAWGKDSQSELQRKDVDSLIHADLPLDWDYLGRWALDLGLEDELRRVHP